MKPDLLMFIIGMFMALIVSFLGMMLAYLSYKKRKNQDVTLEVTKKKGINDD